MAASPSSPSTFRVGDWEVDLRTGELNKPGSKLRLQEQPLQILQVLLEHRGDVVSRQELRERIWPADTYVDFDHGLYSAIKRLRDTLGDNADHPNYIQTLSRRGYRLIAAVSGVGTTPVDSSSLNTQENLSSEVSKARHVFPTGMMVWIGVLLLVTLALFSFTTMHSAVSRTLPQPSISSIAVLPLENLSQDPEQEYFADGMTDELTTMLARMGTVRVVSRTSTMRYKKTTKTLPQIGQELKVDAIVEGTVERSGNRVRIRVQLVQAELDRHLWAQTYDRELRDTLVLQSEAAEGIVREIQSNLISPKAGLHRARQVDPEAYEAYLKGMYFSNKRSEPNFTRAIQYFQQAIARDPNYANAYSGLSDALIGQIYTDSQSDQVREKATSAAEKSIALDSSLQEAHVALATIREMYDWNWAAAESEYRQALALNPNFAAAHQQYALFLATQGRFDQSFYEAQRAQELDPVSPFVRTTYCLGLGIARRYQKAIEKCHEALELDPNFLHAHGNLGGIYSAMGLMDKSVEEYQKAAALRGADRREVAHIRTIFEQGGMKALWRKWATREQGTGSRHDPFSIATLYSLLNEKDQSFFWLEQAYRERSPLMEFIKEDANFDNLRADPRYRELVTKIGMDR